MKATVEPTPDLYDAPINGVMVPVRIWRGRTEGGVPIEAYVLTITPEHAADAATLQAELPGYMRPTREMYRIDTRSEAARRADHISPDRRGTVIDIRDDEEKTKLLIARGEIEAILRKHDLCAHITLIGIQRLEVMLNLDASWSNLSLMEDERGSGIRLRSKLAEYQGDKERQRQDLAATCGMVRLLGEQLAMGGIAWLEAAEQFDEKTGAQHTPTKFEPKQ